MFYITNTIFFENIFGTIKIILVGGQTFVVKIASLGGVPYSAKKLTTKKSHTSLFNSET